MLFSILVSHVGQSAPTGISMASSSSGGKNARHSTAELEERRRVRQRHLQGLKSVGGVSDAVLAKIVQRVRTSAGMLDDPTKVTRRSIGDAGKALMSDVRCSEKLQQEGGAEFVLTYCDPNLLVAKLVDECSALQSVYEAALLRTPCREDKPWTIMVTMDEYSPGNALSHDNKRKTMNINFSFKELHGHTQKDDAWCTPMTLRNTVAANIVGGYSRMLCVYLRRQLIGPHGCMVVGIPLRLGDRHVVLWATLGNLLADGEGFELAYEWRGAGSLRPCLKHYNVLAKGCQLAVHDTSNTFVEITCPDTSRFLAWTHESLRENAATALDARNQYDAGTLGKTRFKDVLQTAGFNTTSNGLLADEDLAECVDLVAIITYDWMHVFLQGGILSDELWAMFHRSKHLGCSAETLQQFMADKEWCFPKSRREKMKAVHEVFSPKRSPGLQKLKASASEHLNLYGLMRYFVEVNIPHDASVAKERASFMACCQAVDTLLEAKRSHNGAAAFAEPLRRQVERWFDLHQQAYQDQLIKPKSHWAMDICDQLRRDNMVLDAFTLERLHLRAKRVADNCDLSDGFEEAVLVGILAQQMESIRGGSLEGGLLGKQRKLDDLPDTMAAAGLQWNGIEAWAGDLVFADNVLGEVVTAARPQHGEPYVIVQLFEQVDELTAHCSSWKASGQLAIFQTDRLKFPLAWKTEGDVVRIVE